MYFVKTFAIRHVNLQFTTTNIGMLSKSRGQVLRVATVLHVLFNPEASPLPDQISDAAVKAAVNLVKVANQQTAYMAGRKTLEEELEKCRTGM